MAVTHPSTVRDQVCDTVVDLLDAGSTKATLDMQDSGSTTIVILTFSDPAFGAASTGLATASAITDGTATIAGTITKGFASASCSTQVVLFSITSTGGGGDIELSSVVISSGQTVSITALTYEAPS